MKYRALLLLVVLPAFILLAGLAAAAGERASGQFLPPGDGDTIVASNRSPTITFSPTVTVTLPVILQNYDHRVLFMDDFSNENSGWPVGGQDGDTWGYVGGEYRLLLGASSPGWLMTPDLVLPADYRIDVDARLLTAKGLVGLVFNADWNGGNSTYYQFLVDPSSGSFLLNQRTSENWVTRIDWRESGHIHQGSASNNLRVDFIGRRIQLYINDALVGLHEGSHPIGPGRDAGLRTYAIDSQPADARYDNFRASIIEPSNPLFRDDFSSEASDWYTGESSTSVWRYINGEYLIWTKNAGYWSGVTWPVGGGLSQYVLEVDMRRPSGDKTAYGLIFEGLDWGNFYVYLIDPSSQKYLVARLEGGSWHLVVGPTYSSRINSGSATNQLKLVHNGSTIGLFVNGYWLADSNDSSWYNRLSVGFYMESYANEDAALYDNFVYWHGTSTTPMPASAPEVRAPATAHSVASGQAVPWRSLPLMPAAIP